MPASTGLGSYSSILSDLRAASSGGLGAKTPADSRYRGAGEPGQGSGEPGNSQKQAGRWVRSCVHGATWQVGAELCAWGHLACTEVYWGMEQHCGKE